MIGKIKSLEGLKISRSHFEKLYGVFSLFGRPTNWTVNVGKPLIRVRLAEINEGESPFQGKGGVDKNSPVQANQREM